jgi:hypothetical protein
MFEPLSAVELKAIHTLLTNPNRWCKGWFAQNQQGKPVLPDDPAAFRFSITGAICRVRKTHWQAVVDSPTDWAFRQHTKQNLEAWNDEQSHETLLTLLEKVCKS